MKKILSAILCGAAILAMADSTVPPTDSATLQGDWTGRDLAPDAAPGSSHFIVSGNHVEFRGADTNEWYKGTFTLREDATPKQLVFKIEACPFQQYVGKNSCAIYRFEKNTLILSGNEPGNPDFPAAFDASAARRFEFKK